jgi:predicted acyltransferase
VVDLGALVPVYLFAVGLGIAVTAAVYIQAGDDAPQDRRRRVGVALVCAVLGLFPLPLFLLVRR